MGKETEIVRFVNGQAGKCRSFDLTMNMIAQYGHWVLILYGVLLWFAPTGRKEKRRRRVSCTRIVTAVGVASFVSFVLGKIWNRKRPFMEDWMIWNFTGHRPTPSFPSNHAMNGIIVAMQLLRDQMPGAKGLSAFCGVLAFSRIFAGVHYLSDILGGVVLAGVAHSLVNHRAFRGMFKSMAKCPAGLTRRISSLWERR